MPESPARAAAAQTAPERRASAGGEPIPLDRHPQELAFQANDDSGKSGVRDEDVRAHAQQRERLPIRIRPGQHGRERGLRPNAAEPAGRAADLPRGVRAQRLAGGDDALLLGERELHGHQPRREAPAATQPAARSPAATSSATIPQPPGRSWRRQTTPGFQTSKRRKRKKDASHASRLRRAESGSERGARPPRRATARRSRR